jgi:hypothetical protein
MLGPWGNLYGRSLLFLAGLPFMALSGFFLGLAARLLKGRWKMFPARIASSLGLSYTEAFFPGIATLIPFGDHYYRVVRTRHPRRVAPGENFPVEVALQNLGRKAWDGSGGPFPFRLGTWNPEGRLSLFHDPDSWPRPDRPAGLPGPVGSGETALFRTTFSAPEEPGRYREELAPVAEGQTWHPGQRIVLTIDVS